MRSIQTEVLVIGGGATGTGIVRDLAMRGFKTILVERRDLSYGTTGRYHGLLHSGGRYVVKDQAAARECITENRILRHIMPHCIEDTGGFFVLTPWDDPEYVPRFLAGCQQAGIPVEEVPISQMLRQEPLLNPQISRCFLVPDASADSFLGAESNAASGRAYGAQVLNYHEVSALQRSHGRITGAVCRDLVKDEALQIDADLVVNASGAWAGKIAGSVGIEIQIKPGKGTMVAVNHRIVNTVVNRCKMPADGDILVPAHTVAVIGTTDVQVGDPDKFAIEPWEIRLMLEEGEKLVPGFRDMRMLRAWAGVRPLYQESKPEQGSLESRDISRAYTLLDHQSRDDLAGLVTITSGKWTTYRMMAEATVDLVCSKLGVTRPCRTHLEPLPDAEKHGHHHLGARLASLESNQTYGELVCECELATYADVRSAILKGDAQTLDDIRRDVRLGMGPCQGGFCSLRAVGMLNDLRTPAVEESNAALRDFLQERWKGLLPVLWGQQLRQERLDELIYQGVLNAGALPGPSASRLAPVNYTRPQAAESEPMALPETPFQPDQRQSYPSVPANLPDVLVIGAGLAGLVTAWRSAKGGMKTRLIARGWGATHWSSGCIDVWREAPQGSLEKLVREQPAHPYALSGLDALQAALQALQALSEQAGYPLQGSFEGNWLLPTALGTLRPTCLAPVTMTAGDMRRASRQPPVLVVGFAGYLDFYPALVAANLRLQHIQAESLTLELPTLSRQRFITGRTLANLMDTPDFCLEVIQALKPHLKGAVRVGFPAVLGLQHARQTWQTLQNGLHAPVFEIAGLPPSIPGIRLHNLLLEAVERAGGRVYDGMQAQAASTSGRQVEAVWSEAAARQKANHARSFVLATGGILGGGVVTDYNGRAYEPIFRLPLQPPDLRQEWFQTDFFAPGGQPIHRTGLVVDRSFRPLDSQAEAYYENLYAVGSMLAHSDGIRDGSLEGVALATGYALGERIAGVR